jgi:hypothetical protein
MPSKQLQATKYIGDLLKGRKLEIEPGIVLLGSDEAWQVFEYGRGARPHSNAGLPSQNWQSSSVLTAPMFTALPR